MGDHNEPDVLSNQKTDLGSRGDVERLSLKRGTGNRGMGMGNGEWGMGNGEWGMGNGERGTENL